MKGFDIGGEGPTLPLTIRGLPASMRELGRIRDSTWSPWKRKQARLAMAELQVLSDARDRAYLDSEARVCGRTERSERSIG